MTRRTTTLRRNISGELGAHPNVVIGERSPRRTGGGTCGRDVSSAIPRVSKPHQKRVPPYSLSVFAVAGWRAALRDIARARLVSRASSESRELIYGACDRLRFRMEESR